MVEEIISPIKENKMPRVKFKHLLIAFFVVLGISAGYFLGKSSTGLAVSSSGVISNGKFIPAGNFEISTTQVSLNSVPIMNCVNKIGLNVDDFGTCFNSGIKESVIEEDTLLAMSYGVSYTPTFIFNCKYRLFDPTKESFDEMITSLKTDNMDDYINMINERYNITAMREQARAELTAKANANKTSLINRILGQGDASTAEEAEEILSKSIDYLVDLYVPSVEVPEAESCGNGVIKLVEFGEFKCPGCYAAESIVKEVLDEIGNKF